ncbi:MAG: GNAT family N-acetyltransferase [Hyphomicrobiaceae bacterium]
MQIEIDSPSASASRAEACARITAALPDWFGLEDANRRYVEDAARYEALAARTKDSTIIGLLVYKPIPASSAHPAAIDIHWLGLLPQFHHHGIGTQLIESLSQLARVRAVPALTVETLDPSADDPNYLRTYSFYVKQGFQVCAHFNFGPDNPAVKMVRPV